MTGLAERFAGQGLALSWEPSVVGWLLAHARDSGQRSVERLIDEHVSALLVHHLPGTAGAPPRAVRLQCEGDRLQVAPDARG